MTNHSQAPQPKTPDAATFRRRRAVGLLATGATVGTAIIAAASFGGESSTATSANPTPAPLELGPLQVTSDTQLETGETVNSVEEISRKFAEETEISGLEGTDIQPYVEPMAPIEGDGYRTDPNNGTVDLGERYRATIPADVVMNKK